FIRTRLRHPVGKVAVPGNAIALAVYVKAVFVINQLCCITKIGWVLRVEITLIAPLVVLQLHRLLRCKRYISGGTACVMQLTLKLRYTLVIAVFRTPLARSIAR